MSILSNASKPQPIVNDQVYVIYGLPGTGKTTLAFSFPKTKDKKLLYIDILEGGAGVIRPEDKPYVTIAKVNDFSDLDEILTDVMNGYTIDENGKKIPVQFSTIVIDSVTQLENLIKSNLKKVNEKEQMTLNLWGQAKENHEVIYNTLKLIHNKTGAIVVAIAHEKQVENEKDAKLVKVIPSLMQSAAYSLCAKASYVFYTAIENNTRIDPKTKETIVTPEYMTYLDRSSIYLSKIRKPIGFTIPSKIKNLTYDSFKRNVLDKLCSTTPKSSDSATKK